VCSGAHLLGNRTEGEARIGKASAVDARAGERLDSRLFFSFFVPAQRVNGENINICGKKAKDESLKKLHRTSAQASAEIMSKQRVLIGACVPH